MKNSLGAFLAQYHRGGVLYWVTPISSELSASQQHGIRISLLGLSDSIRAIGQHQIRLRHGPLHKYAIDIRAPNPCRVCARSQPRERGAYVRHLGAYVRQGEVPSFRGTIQNRTVSEGPERRCRTLPAYAVACTDGRLPLSAWPRATTGSRSKVGYHLWHVPHG